MKFKGSWQLFLAGFALSLLLHPTTGSAYGLGLRNEDIQKYAAEKVCPGPEEQTQSPSCQTAKAQCIQELNNCFHQNVEATVHCYFDDFDGDKLKCKNQEVCVQESDGGCAVAELTMYEKPLYACINEAKQHHTQAIGDACNFENSPAVCGDGHVSGDEICDGTLGKDDTIIVGKCSQDCRTISTCGNGITEGEEACDAGKFNGTPGHCNATCTATETGAGGAFPGFEGENPAPKPNQSPGITLGLFPTNTGGTPLVVHRINDAEPNREPEELSYDVSANGRDEFVTMAPAAAPSLQGSGCSLGTSVTDSPSSLAPLCLFFILMLRRLNKSSRHP